MNFREIPRLPDVPRLTDSTIALLTELCFREDDALEPVDVIFVFGTHIYILEFVQLIEQLLELNISNTVIINGGNAKLSDSVVLPKPGSELIFDALNRDIFPSVHFIVENTSTNTLDNVRASLGQYNFSSVSSVLFLFKSHAAGRGYLTLRKFLPRAKLLQKTISVAYSASGEPLTSFNWFLSDEGRRRVWGEYLRIKTYGERGDIAFDEVRNLVMRIGESVE
jgi:hypothetical protein